MTHRRNRGGGGLSDQVLEGTELDTYVGRSKDREQVTGEGGMRMKVYDTVTACEGGGAWEAIRDKGNPWTDLSFLKATEEAGVVPCQHRYFEFRQDGQTVLTMSGAVLINDLVMFGGEGVKKAAGLVRKLAPSFLRPKTLEIGPLLGLGTSISQSAEATPATRLEAVKAIQGYAREQEIDLVVVRDFRGARGAMEGALEEAGFRALFNLPVAQMEIAWDTFEEYERALKHRFANNMRRNMKKKREHGIRSVVTRDGLGMLERQLRLYENVRSRSPRFSRDAIGEAHYRAMVKHFGRHCFWLQYFLGETLVAYMQFLRYGKLLVAQYVGMDYDVARRAGLYFNSYYDLVRLAIEQGLGTVDMGLTTYEAKSAAGFSVLPQVMYVWTPNRMLLTTAAVMWKRMTHYEIERCHHAFKDEKYQTIWDGRTSDGSEWTEAAGTQGD
ncbi:MAG: GNAT family N-acetyltransferase [Planctomycetota bacterium]